MNKKITIIAILAVVLSIFLGGVSKEQQELYLKAMAEKDSATKMQLLKEYTEKYADSKDKFLKFAYLNLSNTAYNLKNYDETIQYGEIALGYEDMDAANKLVLFLSLANSFYATQRDMDKAFRYSQSLIDLTNSLLQQARGAEKQDEQSQQTIAKYENYYLAPAYRLQGLVLYFKGKDNPDNIKQAAEKAVEAYNYHKTDIYYQMAFSLAGNLAQKGKFEDAAKISEKIIDNQKIKYQEADFLAKLYTRLKNKEKSIYYYEMAYKDKPNGSLAMIIGQLIHKQDAPKAIQYFADAYVLGQMNKETDAFKYLEHLYFNEIAKDKTPAEKEEGFKQVIAAAKARLGIKEEQNPTPNT